MTREPSPEVKQIIRDWVKIQQERYGSDWKKILSKEMAKEATPFIKALIALQKGAKK